MISLQYASLTDTGRKREENEDCIWAQVRETSALPMAGLFVVCDGMGGHMGGKYASYWAVEAVKLEFGELFSAKDPRATLVLTKQDIEAIKQGTYTPPQPKKMNLEKLMQVAISKANSVVYQYARHKPKQAANAVTTIAMMAVLDKQALIANIGDSRVYLLRDHTLTQITHDHSLVASMVTEGKISPNEVYTHPQRNMIYRFLGQKGDVKADIFRESLQPGDQVMLCSDGLWEMIRSEERMLSLIEQGTDLQSTCQMLVEAANQAGGDDNISVILVRVNGG